MNIESENKCLICGQKMTPHTENYPLKALQGTVLLDVTVWRCAECGEYEIEIPRLEELMNTVAAMVIGQESRLTGDEIRFLRDFLDLKQTALAAKLGIDSTHLSRAENGDPLGQQTDRLLRMIVAYEIRMEGYADQLETVANTEPTEWRAKIAFRGDHWEPAA